MAFLSSSRAMVICHPLRSSFLAGQVYLSDFAHSELVGSLIRARAQHASRIIVRRFRLSLAIRYWDL